MPTLAQLRRLHDYIRKSNARFKKMSREQKKVQIAKDVLLQLDLKRMKAGSVYFESETVDKKVMRLIDDGDGGVEYQKLLKKMPSCRVCGVGSTFIAAVYRLDNLTVGDMGWDTSNRSMMEEYLWKMRIFTPNELEIIESSFEMNNNFCPPSESNKPTARLRRVMNQIIQCKGIIDSNTFKDSRHWHYR